ncbi:MAG: sarcosine oxidase subunit alpha family protein [Alphaproteobacteria bacterium]|nr:sarcosine oxidase subunit alpha family protein [Alphaproteobacteria bacterium]
MTGFRLAAGGRIDRARRIGFTFDGTRYHGYAGDTLASALLANGVSTVGRSFKYHRRRGVFAAGADEANAIVTVGDGARATPNLKATQVPLYEGLVARSVNAWPSAAFDVGALVGAVGRFLPAGFYYKTFMRPDWHLFEPTIRRAAGLGAAPRAPDPDRYEQISAHCDVLVVGAGPAGLAAALHAARAGARVMLVDEQAEAGGRLLADGATIDDAPAADWIARVEAELAACDDVVRLPRTTVFGYYDHNLLGAYEQIALPGAPPPAQRAAGRLWRIRARRVVLATGAFERPLVFADNDLPGVMLAGAVRSYVTRHGVAPGERAIVATNNDDAYATALALHDAGVEIAQVVDSRSGAPPAEADMLRARGVAITTGAVIERALGGRAVAGAVMRRLGGGATSIEADLIAVSGGWNPAVHLFCQSGGRLAYDEAKVAFVPAQSVQDERSAGACRGSFSLADALREGARAAAWATGRPVDPVALPAVAERPGGAVMPLWETARGGKAWVDLLSDVTADDVRLAARENYRSVEHLKRYTTLGMAADQGKTSNVVGLAILAAATQRSIAEVGTTRFRPPFDPIPFGALAGRAHGDLYQPRLELPMRAQHAALGALFEDFGAWRRPAAYPRHGENLDAAARREARHVRRAVGIMDGSPLGKIEVRGPDAATFLDRMYVGTMSTLPVGRVRYGLMLTEHGIVTDDGVCARLGAEHFLVGTSSAAASRIATGFDEWLQGEWPDLRVFATNLTSRWAVITLTGPRARDVLAALGTDIDLAPPAFPHMAVREGRVGGIAARVFRVSFTGELSFEINVAARAAPALWERAIAAGAAFDIAPFGIEALMTLRIEKGYIHVGSETDGMTVPDDIGMGGAIARKAADFVGRRSLLRPEATRGDRKQLVGLMPEDSDAALRAGAHLVSTGPRDGTEGWITSACWSPALGRWIALGMLARGRHRKGERVIGYDEGRETVLRVVEPCFVDPKGARLDG